MFSTSNPPGTSDPLSTSLNSQLVNAAQPLANSLDASLPINRSSAPTGNGNGLKGEYYSGRDFNSLKRTRTDATVDFDWGTQAPIEALSPDVFTIRWTGQIQPRFSETYTFFTSSDDGIRLWVNGQKLIDNWTEHSATENFATIDLQAGQKYDIKLEYFEQQGLAVSKLLWSSSTQMKEIVPQSQLFSILEVVDSSSNTGSGGSIDTRSLVSTVNPLISNPTVSGSSSPSGKFTTQGSKIYGPDGKEFIAKGTNANGPNSMWERETTQDIDEMVDAWRFNAVRLHVYLYTGEFYWNGRIMPQYTTNNDLDKIVQALTNRGVVSVLTIADRKAYAKNDLTVEAWLGEQASKYRNNPYVWFDTFNEPGPAQPTPESLNTWVNFNRKMIDIIRSSGNDSIILVEGSGWGQDAGDWNKSPVKTQRSSILSAGDRVRQGYSNIAFSIHVYDQWNGGDARLADYIDRVHALGMPLVVGEVGPQNGSANTMEAVRSLYRVGPQRGVGILNWGWPGGDGNVLARSSDKKGGWTIDSFTNPTNLTEFGKLVWESTHSAP